MRIFPRFFGKREVFCGDLTDERLLDMLTDCIDASGVPYFMQLNTGRLQKGLTRLENLMNFSDMARSYLAESQSGWRDRLKSMKDKGIIRIKSYRDAFEPIRAEIYDKTGLDIQFSPEVHTSMLLGLQNGTITQTDTSDLSYEFTDYRHALVIGQKNR